MLARCPTCRNTFRAERPGRQDCPVCGKPLIVPESAPAPPDPQETGQPPPAALPPAGGAAPQPAGTPWERRAGLGLWTAWVKTVSQALVEPSALYASARLDRGGAQLGFALATGSAFWAVGQILDRLLLGKQREQILQLWAQQLPPTRSLPAGAQWLLGLATTRSFLPTLLFALLAPLFVLVFLYASAAVTHLCAMLLGQNRRGFSATFAAAAYAFAPFVLFAIPGCGGLAGWIWCAVLTGIGLKATHGISAGGAAAATLAPYALLCCASCALSLAIGAIATRALQAAG